MFRGKFCYFPEPANTNRYSAFSPLHFFDILLCCSLMLKSFKYIFFLINLPWIPHNVVNSMKWKWFGKAHTIMSHSWQCISEQKPSHELEGAACRAQRQDCVETQIWGRLQNIHTHTLTPTAIGCHARHQPACREQLGLGVLLKTPWAG